jgi:hypothetical protein
MYFYGFFLQCISQSFNFFFVFEEVGETLGKKKLLGRRGDFREEKITFLTHCIGGPQKESLNHSQQNGD